MLIESGEVDKTLPCGRVGYKSGRVGYILLTEKWLFFGDLPQTRGDKHLTDKREGLARLRRPLPLPLAGAALASKVLTLRVLGLFRHPPSLEQARLVG